MEIGTTLTRFLLEEERKHPGASGAFTELLTDITLVGKLISREVNKAGLAKILGLTGETNVQGEAVQKLDEMANATVLKHVEHTGRVAALASEEMEKIYHVPEGYPRGNYVLVFDPLDGSSNIDVNVAIGTIFAVYRRKGDGPSANLADFLQPGREQVCAGYVIYGSSTMLVYTTKNAGVHGFTLDPTVGEFLLSHENIRIPAKGKIYSVNEANAPNWDEGTRRYVESRKGEEGTSARYVGTLVADFHRNLLKGGIFLYPGDKKNPSGKLRLLYEASPMAMIVENAGGRASTGRERILDIVPTELHQRVPLAIGSAEDVAAYEACLKGQ